MKRRILKLMVVVVLVPSAGSLQAQPVITSQPASQAVWPGSNVTLTVTVAGVGPFAYNWQFNGTNLPNNLICTVAGQSSVGFSGDGGPATNASLHLPGRVQFDRGRNLLIPDTVNNRVRKVDTNGFITTVAGNGTAADSGDGGAATNASLNFPNDVAWDAAGNMYIGDYQRVRKVNTNGIIATVTSAVWNASGLSMDGSGRLYIAQYQNAIVSRLDSGGALTTVAGPGSPAFLKNPSDVRLDATGNLYITDSGSHRVRKVDTHGIITTVAGNGQAGYSGDGSPATNASLYFPQTLTMDAQGNLFIADSYNHRVREVDTNGIITTVAGNGTSEDTGDGGAATDAGVSYPWGIAFNSAGNLFVSTDHQVREIGWAGSPTLMLRNVSLSNGGAYGVIITSSGGSVTSLVATVTVQVPPTITGLVRQSNGAVALAFTGTPNSTNRVWVTSDLTPLVAWLPISTNVAGADGRWQCTDSDSVSCSTRFYRASMP